MYTPARFRVGIATPPQARIATVFAVQWPYEQERAPELRLGDDQRDYMLEQVAQNASGTKRYHHPLVGDLTLDWDTFTCPTDPDQQIVFHSAEPGSPSDERLRILASWAATNEARDHAAAMEAVETEDES